MQLLIELLQLNEERLLEDLGNLKVIDPEFMRHLKDKVYIGGRGGRDFKKEEAVAKKAGRSYSDYDRKQYERINDALGKDSEVEEQDITKAGQALDAFKITPTPLKNIRLVILKCVGVQVLAIILEKTERGEKRSYKVVASRALFDKIIPRKEYEAKKPLGNSKWNKDEFDADKLLRGLTTTATNKIRDIIEIILNEVEIAKMMTVSVDVTRFKKQTERANARYKGKPYQTGNRVAVGGGKYKEYDKLADDDVKDLLKDFRDKLEKYKASKAQGADTIEDLLKFIEEKGYLDKIKFMGFTYTLERANNFHLSNLKKASKSTVDERDQPNIEYRHDSNDPAIEKLRASLDEIKRDKKVDDEAAMAEYHKERDKLLPSRTLEVAMGFKGGMIVPIGIRLSKDRSWLF